MKVSYFTVIFTISGICALMYQIFWMRLFSFVLGNTYAAISIIVASFMFGLFFGSWLIAKYIERISNPLKWYAYLEILIGVYAFALLFGFESLKSFYISFHIAFYSSELINQMVKFLFTVVLILIPTSSMGATLPLAVQYFTKSKSSFKDNVSVLYAVNTFGGAIGVLLAGFYLIEYIGINNGILLAALLNILAGIIVLISIKQTGTDPLINSKVTSNTKNEAIISNKTKSGKFLNKQNNKIFLLISAGLAGYTALGYEVIWTRGLKFIILNSTYGFASVLFVFLLGIAIGGFISKKIRKNQEAQFHLYGLLQISLGLFAILSIYFLYTLVYSDFFNNNIVNIIYSYSYNWRWIIFAFIMISLVFFLIPTIIMGILFPLINDLYFHRINRAGKTVSSIYAINTIGAILGSLSAGFILIPMFGIKASIYILAFINLILGLVFIFKSRLKLKPVFLLGIPVALILFYLSGINNYLLGNNEKKSDDVLFYEESLIATVKVYQRNNTRYLSIDGTSIASTNINLLKKEILIAQLPFFLSKNAKDILSVGLASGISTGSMTLHNNINIDCVELVKPVFKAAEYFSEHNHNIYSQRNVNFYHDDVYSFLMYSDKKYDIISSDGKFGAFHSGNTIMLALDYYELCKKRLNEDGIFIQWVPTITPHDAFKIIVNTLKESFNYMYLFYFYPSDIFMIASESPVIFDKLYMDLLFKNNQLQQELAKIDIKNSYSILSSYVGQYYNNGLQELQINSFNRPVLEFRYLRDWKKNQYIPGGYRAQNLQFLTSNYQNTDINRLFDDFINVDKENIHENLYAPTLSFLRFATDNFVNGNYIIGLQEYIKFKDQLKF